MLAFERSLIKIALPKLLNILDFYVSSKLAQTTAAQAPKPNHAMMRTHTTLERGCCESIETGGEQATGCWC